MAHLGESYDVEEQPKAVVIQTFSTEYEVWVQSRPMTVLTYDRKEATFEWERKALEYAERLNRK